MDIIPYKTMAIISVCLLQYGTNYYNMELTTI